jgi:hypothetical protein
MLEKFGSRKPTVLRVEFAWIQTMTGVISWVIGGRYIVPVARRRSFYYFSYSVSDIVVETAGSGFYPAQYGGGKK